MGFRYTATWQADDVMRDRMNKGRCFVAIEGGALVGTLTLYFPASHLRAEYYRREGSAALLLHHQFHRLDNPLGVRQGGVFVDRVEADVDVVLRNQLRRREEVAPTLRVGS